MINETTLNEGTIGCVNLGKCGGWLVHYHTCGNHRANRGDHQFTNSSQTDFVNMMNGRKVRELREGGMGATAIAKELGIGRASVYRVLG